MVLWTEGVSSAGAAQGVLAVVGFGVKPVGHRASLEGRLILRRCVAMLCVLAALAPAAARAEYRLSSGDEVELNVFRVPELNRTATVDIDGRVAIPPIGLVDAAGATVENLAASIRERLISEMSLQDAKVTVALVAPSPVYVGGDVGEPGAYPFRAALSVRRAVALAGGVGIARESRAEDIARLRGELEVQAIGVLRARARSARVTAELAGERTLGEVAEQGAAAPRRDEILALESQRLVDNLEEAASDKAFLERRLGLAVERLTRLNEQQGLQTGLIERQLEELDRIGDIVNRGLGVQSQLNEERRAYTSMQERLSDTEARIAEAEVAIADARHELERFDDRRAATLTAQAQEALLDIETAETELAAISGELGQMGFRAAQSFEITIYRNEDGAEIAMPASEDTALRPGDMVEIVLDDPRMTGGPAPAAPTQ